MHPTMPTTDKLPPTPRPAPRAANASREPFVMHLSEQGYPLIWPLALRALGMGLRPSRLATSYFLLVTLLALLALASAWMPKHAVGVTDTPSLAAQDAMGEFFDALAATRIGHAGALLIAMPATIAQQFPRIAFLLVLPIAVVVGLLGGCVVRSSVVEFATGERASWAASMGQTLTHARGATLVLVGPLLLAGMLAAAASVGSWVLGVRGLSTIASVAFILVLGVSFVLVLLLTLWLASLPLSLAATLSEGEGALDATQRAFAYVASRPLRVAGYYVLLAVLLCAALALSWWFVRGTLGVAAWSAGNLLDPTTAEQVRGALIPAKSSGKSMVDQSSGMVRVLGFWRTAMLLLVPASGVSLILSGSGVVYLLLRQGIDGRDRRGLWDPRKPERPAPAFLQTINELDEATPGA
jgi:hypothetical protein